MNSQASPSRGSQSKVKWVDSVRIYLCGNEINSKLIRQELEEEQESEDSVSRKSSDTNLTRKQNLAKDSSSAVRMELHEDRNQVHSEMQFLMEEKAAVSIQSAYKGFMVCQSLRSSMKMFASKFLNPGKTGLLLSYYFSGEKAI
jgi:hypothetical protein